MGSPATLPDGKPGLSLRMGKMKAGPVVSDNGCFIIDAPFPQAMMEKPEKASFPKDATLRFPLIRWLAFE